VLIEPDSPATWPGFSHADTGREPPLGQAIRVTREKCLFHRLKCIDDCNAALRASEISEAPGNVVAEERHVCAIGLLRDDRWISDHDVTSRVGAGCEVRQRVMTDQRDRRRHAPARHHQRAAGVRCVVWRVTDTRARADIGKIDELAVVLAKLVNLAGVGAAQPVELESASATRLENHILASAALDFDDSVIDLNSAAADRRPTKVAAITLANKLARMAGQ
jgi:hypothetical protein